jgi:hypothetical protein
MKLQHAALAAIVVVVACGSKTTEPSGSGGSGSASGIVALATADAKSRPTMDRASLETAAQSLLDTWLRSQNDGDFARYQALYSKWFQGVKRTPTEERDFNHDEWLSDRKRMFAKRPTVTISDLKILVQADGGTSARFIQTWKTDRYSDEGPKVISLTNAAAVGAPPLFQIVREELLAATRIAPKAMDAVFVATAGIWVLVAHATTADLKELSRLGFAPTWIGIGLGDRAAPPRVAIAQVQSQELADGVIAKLGAIASRASKVDVKHVPSLVHVVGFFARSQAGEIVSVRLRNESALGEWRIFDTKVTDAGWYDIWVPRVNTDDVVNATARPNLDPPGTCYGWYPSYDQQPLAANQTLVRMSELDMMPDCCGE